MGFSLAEFARVAGARPENLPPLIVYPDWSWKNQPLCDTRGRLHMATRHLKEIRKQFPVTLVGAYGQMGTVYRIKASKFELNNAAEQAKKEKLFDDSAGASIRRNAQKPRRRH